MERPCLWIDVLRRFWAAVRYVAYVIAAAVALASLYMFGMYWLYVPPAHRAALPPGMVRQVVVVGDWIGIPLDVQRDFECLTQSTFTLRRPDALDPTPDGREDVFILGLSNTSLTGTGIHHLMLWFKKPKDLPGGGTWDIYNKTETDCGTLGNKSVSEPLTSKVGSMVVAATTP